MGHGGFAWLGLAMLVGAALPAAASGPDYPGASWAPACSCNYTTSNRESTLDIRWIVIHTAEGSYEGTISWFQNPDAQASAHFVAAKDGRVAQMVHNKDIAWHAGNWKYNQHSVGIEHEGFSAQASTWTDAMYKASARLTRWLVDTYGVPLAHPTGVAPADPLGVAGGIIGHNQVPDPNNPQFGGGAGRHTDPGPHFDWDYFMSLVRGDTFTVKILAPPHDQWVRGTIQAQGSTSQEANLKWMRFLVDGALTKWVTPQPHAWGWDTRSWSDGAHALALEGENQQGARASDRITVKIDNTPPTAAITAPKAGAVHVSANTASTPAKLTIAAGRVPFTAAASDPQPGSGVARVEFRVDGALRSSDALAPYAWTWPAEDESLGSHVLSITAVDNVGNARTVSLGVDLVAPSTLRGLGATLQRYA